MDHEQLHATLDSISSGLDDCPWCEQEGTHCLVHQTTSYDLEKLPEATPEVTAQLARWIHEREGDWTPKGYTPAPHRYSKPSPREQSCLEYESPLPTATERIADYEDRSPFGKVNGRLATEVMRLIGAPPSRDSTDTSTSHPQQDSSATLLPDLET